MPTAADHSPAAQAPEEAVTTTLYRAAIGPVSNGYYLPIFTRFEEADHAGISWNSAAAVNTVNWLVFRQLWAAALAYVGTVVALVLLVFGIGRLVFQFSDTLMMALALGFGLAAFVLPGLFGNALLHTEYRKRMTAAVGAHAEIKDACIQLSRQASTRRRAIALAVANAAFWMLMLYSYLQFSALGSLAVMPQGALEPGNVAVGRTVDATAPLPGVTPIASAPAPASAPASAPMVIASAAAVPASQPASQPASAPTPAASVPITAPSSPLPGASAVQPALAAASVPATVPARATSAPQAMASSPRAREPEKAVKPAKPVKAAKSEEKPAKPAKAVPAAPKTKASAPAKSAPSSADKPYYINVGVFAKPENAANAHAKLLEAQLPSVSKELKSSKVPSLTRVRVGPFDSQLEAQVAVEKIKALQLDAIMVQP